MLLRMANPVALWGLVIIALIALRLGWKRKYSPHLFSTRRSTTMLAALVLCILALARPQGGTQVTAQQGVTSNVFVAIDISRSMLAQDVSPSRLGFAVAYLQKLFVELGQAKVALFAFAQEGYLMMPLSSDVYAAADLLTSVHPSNTTAQGTDFNRVLEGLSQQILRAEEKAREKGGDWVSPQVVFVSDGESHEPLKTSSLKWYRERNIPIFTVLTGTTQGTTIPVEGRFQASLEPLKDENGKLVVTHASSETMQAIAGGTGGYAYRGGLSEVTALAQRLRQSMQMGKLTTTFRLEKEFFSILLVIAFALFFFEFALGKWEFVLRSALLLFSVGSLAMADGAGSERAIQIYNEGLKNLESQDLEKAAEQFQESALTTQETEIQKKALYNLGNTFLRMNDPAQALSAYQKAFDLKTENPSFDQETNKKISENIVLAIKQEEQQKKQQKKQQGDGEGDGKESNPGQDPKGPQKYEGEPLTDGMKQKIYDQVSNEEKQTMQRLQDQQRKNSPHTGKTW